MGGSKSKPVKESAKAVLAKRRQSPAGPIGNIDLNRKIDLRIDPRMVSRNDENAMDIDVLNKMSKWSAVKSDEQKLPVIDKHSQTSGSQIKMRSHEQEIPATMVRLEEEKRSSAATYVVPDNRLTEEHLTEMLKMFRGSSENKDCSEITEMAKEYRVDASVAALLHKYVRSPILIPQTDKDNSADEDKGSFLAR